MGDLTYNPGPDPGQLSLLDALDPHTHARTCDPDTSHTAAARLSSKRTMLRALLRTYAAHGPQITDQAIWRAGYEAAAGAWKRVSDLERLGLIEDTGERRNGLSGRPQIVRRITDAGRRSLS